MPQDRKASKVGEAVWDLRASRGHKAAADLRDSRGSARECRA